MSWSTASGTAAATRWRSRLFTITCVRPSTTASRKPSMISIGSSWRIAAERLVSP
jgi:hypothetical protein